MVIGAALFLSLPPSLAAAQDRQAAPPTAESAAAESSQTPTVADLLQRMNAVLAAIEEEQTRQQENPLLALEVDALKRRVLRLEQDVELLRKALTGARHQ